MVKKKKETPEHNTHFRRSNFVPWNANMYRELTAREKEERGIKEEPKKVDVPKPRSNPVLEQKIEEERRIDREYYARRDEEYRQEQFTREQKQKNDEMWRW